MKNEIELAWAAGFFDGEGCICIKREGRYYRIIRLSICQTDKTPLIRFRNIFNFGKIVLVNIKSPGKIITANGNIRERVLKPKWLLDYYGARAIKTIHTIYPYLSKPKQEQYQRIYTEIYNSPDERVVTHYSLLGA